MESISNGPMNTMIRVGFVDEEFLKKEVFEGLVFNDFKLLNPYAELRRCRGLFLQDWMENCIAKEKRQPQINIFFEVPESEWLFVHQRWCGECKRGKRLVLNRETFNNPIQLVTDFLTACKKSQELWEAFSESQARKKNILRFPPRLRVVQ